MTHHEMADHQADGPTEVSEIVVTKDEERQEYAGHVDDVQVGYVSYVNRDDAIELPHTVVKQEFGGRGYASAIVRFALDDIRAQNKHVIPTCPYVSGWIEKHPEYADLVAL